MPKERVTIYLHYHRQSPKTGHPVRPHKDSRPLERELGSSLKILRLIFPRVSMRTSLSTSRVVRIKGGERRSGYVVYIAYQLGAHKSCDLD